MAANQGKESKSLERGSWRLQRAFFMGPGVARAILWRHSIRVRYLAVHGCVAVVLGDGGLLQQRCGVGLRCVPLAYGWAFPASWSPLDSASVPSTNCDRCCPTDPVRTRTCV